MGVREVRVRDALARHLSAAAGTGHAAPRGAPAPPVPCHVAAGEAEGGVSAPGLAAQVGVSESTATLVPGRLRGAMARPGCLRRAVGRGRGGRLPRRRARQDEEARAGWRGPRARGRCSRRPGAPRAGLGRRSPGVVPNCRGPTWGSLAPGTSAPTGGGAPRRAPGPGPGPPWRRFDADGRDASLPTARHVISNLESWATGTSRGLSTAGPRSYADEFSWRYSHRGRDATTALVADCCLGHYRRDQLRGEAFRPQPRPARPGASGRRGEYR